MVNESKQKWIDSTYRSSWKGLQVTEDETHPRWYKASPSTGDVGGEFFMQRQIARLNPVSVSFVQKFLGQPGQYPKFLHEEYSGILLPSGVPTSVVWPPNPASSRETLEQLGATAIARCKPTNSVADLATFLGELYKDSLPRLGVNTWEMRTGQANLARQKAKDVGGDYLNYEFAIKPLANDVMKFYNAVIHADKVVDQYLRDSGRVVRRQYEFPTEEKSELTRVKDGRCITFTSVLQDSTASVGRTYRRRDTSIRRWFSGAFTYYLDLGEDRVSKLRNYAQRADKLLGIAITPEVLWEVAPWSWAVDWFSNAGDVLSNVSDWATDGLVMRYGYIMEHSSVTDTYYHMGPTGLLNESAQPQSVSFTFEVKRRVKANPFGFGLSWDGLTARQGAILAALGITRGK